MPRSLCRPRNLPAQSLRLSTGALLEATQYYSPREDVILLVLPECLHAVRHSTRHRVSGIATEPGSFQSLQDFELCDVGP